MFNVRRQQVFFLDDVNTVINVTPTVDVMITEVTQDNVRHVLSFRGPGFERSFRRFLVQGQVGVYAWLGSRVVGHAWAVICRAQTYRANGYLDIHRDDALIHFCNVHAAQRGKNIYPVMLAALCRKLFAESKVKRVLIDTAVNNYASVRGITKAGFAPLATGTYIQFRGRLIFRSVRG